MPDKPGKTGENEPREADAAEEEPGLRIEKKRYRPLQRSLLKDVPKGYNCDELLLKNQSRPNGTALVLRKNKMKQRQESAVFFRMAVEKLPFE